jgi:HK97 family phage portal protein
MWLPGGYRLTLSRTSTAGLSTSPKGDGWIPVVRESYPGAWQQNVTITNESVLSYAPVFACVDQISSDIAKLRWRLVELTEDGIWLERENPAYSPLLRTPNRYQTAFQFTQQWLVSKLIHGNTYVLKQRDLRGVVKALYVLDPTAVTPLITPEGAVFYQVTRWPLAGLEDVPHPPAIPAAEMIHDRMMCPFHPLCGVSPIFAAALPAQQGLAIERNASSFFANGSHPGGVVLVPGAINQAQHDKLKEQWEATFGGANLGRVGILSNGMKYEPLLWNAVDAALIDQLKWTGEMVCAVYHVPAYMVQIGPPPAAGTEDLVQLYYAQCLQRLLVSAEQAMDAGLEFPRVTLGTEFDVEDLIWTDTAARTKAAADGIGSGGMSPDEARRRYFNLPKTPGGDTPYMQQQYFSLAALAQRDAEQPFAKAAPAAPAMPAATENDELDQDTISEKTAAELRGILEAAA